MNGGDTHYDSRIGKDTKIVFPCENWYIASGSDNPNAKTKYPKKCPKINGRWAVAVGPGILDPEYDNDGGLTDDDIKPFSKCIKVQLQLKKQFKASKSRPRLRTLECHVLDLKAHSYNKYPYGKDKKGSKFKSDYVTYAKTKPVIKNGIVQTGIRYPNASNESVVAFDNRDGSIIEFCGAELDGLGFKLDEYELLYIESNYETKTRGKTDRRPWKNK